VASIQEITEGGNDSSDVDTVDGNEDVELHDAYCLAASPIRDVLSSPHDTQCITSHFKQTEE
jgi:hypothetical protein